MDSKRANLLLQAMEVVGEDEESKGMTAKNPDDAFDTASALKVTPKKGANIKNLAIIKAIDVAREHPNITIHGAELKAFFLWLEAKQKANGSWITRITRDTLLKACPLVYPEEWDEFQEFLQKNNIVFRTRPWKHIA